MSNKSNHPPLLKDRFFRTGLVSTILALFACLVTHLVTLLGVVGAVAWLGTMEHALVIAVIGLSALTGYAAYKHKRCTAHCPSGQEEKARRVQEE